MKAKSQESSKTKTKQTQPKTKPKHHKKTPGELGETLRFQKRNPLALATMALANTSSLRVLLALSLIAIFATYASNLSSYTAQRLWDHLKGDSERAL